jgi:hypothetical protein
VISYKDMVKQKRSWWVLVAVALSFLTASPLWAEGQPLGQQQGGQQNLNPQPAAGANNIKIWDDRVFDLNGGTQEPESRTSNGGTRRYLDKTKDLDYNTEQRDRWMKSCASLRESDFKAYGDCVDAQKKKELGSRTNFGTRDPRSSDGVNNQRNAPAGVQGVAPMPSNLKPSLPEEGGGGEEPEAE